MDDLIGNSGRRNGHRGVEVIKGDIGIKIPFKPVTLSFQNICYNVTASKEYAEIAKWRRQSL
jgi:hypothetical protein